MRQTGQRGEKPLLPRKALKSTGKSLGIIFRQTLVPARLRGKIDLRFCNFWLQRAAGLAASLANSPETSGREFHACGLLCSFLRDAGFRVIRGLPDLPTAFVAESGTLLDTAPRICFIVEYDALPNLGHACGHNLNAAMALLAAALLAPLVHAAGGSLLVAGTPDEERRGAKALMVRQGVFAGVGLALLAHAGAWKNRPRYRTSAFRSILLGPEPGETDPERVLKWVEKGLLDGEAIRIRTGPDGQPLRLDIMAPSTWRRDILIGKAVQFLTRRRSPFTLDSGEEPLETYLGNGPAEKKLMTIWREMGIPFEGPPLWAGTSDMGNLSRCCPTLQFIMAATDRPLAWHTTTFVDALCETDLSPPILRGALSLACLALLFWEDKTFRRETARAFLIGKSRDTPP